MKKTGIFSGFFLYIWEPILWHMRRFPFFIFVFLVPLILFGCSPELDFVESSLRAGTAEVSFSDGVLSMDFPAEAGASSVQLTASGDWTAYFVNDRAKDWCSVSTEGGKRGTATITMSVLENPDSDDRSAAIVFVCGDAKRTILLTQKQKNGLLLTANRVYMEQAGGRFTIGSNVPFDYSISGNAKSWIKPLSKKRSKSMEISFEVLANNSAEKREGEIIVSGGSRKEVVTVYQEGEKPAIVLSQDHFSLTSDAQEIRVDVQHNVDVKLEIPSDCDWVSEITTKSLSTSVFRLFVSENDAAGSRVCRVKFRAPDKDYSEEVVVEQASRQVLLQRDTLFAYGVGGLVSFEVAGLDPKEYKFDWLDGWLSLGGSESDPRSGRTRFTVKTQSQSFGSEPRDGLLLVYYWKNPVPDTLRIHQYERYPALYYTSSLLSVPVPLITDGHLCAGIVWGDGFQEPYLRDVTHGYSWKGKHTVAIELREQKDISFNNLENGMEIDLHELRKLGGTY